MTGHTGQVNCVKWLPSTGIAGSSCPTITTVCLHSQISIIFNSRLTLLARNPAARTVVVCMPANRSPRSHACTRQHACQHACLCLLESANTRAKQQTKDAEVTSDVSLPCCTCLHAAVTPGGSAVLLSGAADNTIRVWAWHGEQHTPPWTCITELRVHESPVTSLALQVLDNHQLLLASTSADPCIRMWQCDLSNCRSSPQLQQQCDPQQQLQLLQARFGSAAWQQQPDVHVGRVIQHCVALATLPGNPGCVLMATGGTDSTIRLFVCDTSASTASSSSSSHGAASGTAQQAHTTAAAASSPEVPTFKLQCQLKGHENWVKGVAFTAVREPAGQSGQQGGVSLLLATAGQDRYARIWCISTDPDRADASTSSAGGAGAGDDALRKLITRFALCAEAQVLPLYELSLLGFGCHITVMLQRDTSWPLYMSLFSAALLKLHSMAQTGVAVKSCRTVCLHPHAHDPGVCAHACCCAVHAGMPPGHTCQLLVTPTGSHLRLC